MNSGKELEPSSRVIHPKCEMNKYARQMLQSDEQATEYYFQSAEFLICNLVKYFEEEAVDSKNMTILDFASGYGRFTRYFVRLFKQVTVADLEPEMLDFCKNEFGADGFLSSAKNTLAIEEHSRRYDVVFCFSLFTHLRQDFWKDWFEKLYSLVAPNGYFIISTQGYKLFAKVDPTRFGSPEQQKEKFLYLSGNETNGRLDAQVYGTSVVKEEFVLQVASRVKNIRLKRKFEMGEFDQYHDIFIFSDHTP